MRTHTRITDFQSFAERGKSAATVIKLMIACNDMQLADDARTRWKEDQPRLRQGQAAGALMYFTRLQISHLYEALKIVEEVRADPGLMRQLEGYDEQTRSSFNALLPFLQGGARRKWLEHTVGEIRSNLAFHYNESGRLVSQAIRRRASTPATRISSVTRGSTAYLWHFSMGDEVIDNIVVRQIWGIAANKDPRIESDRIMDEVHEIFLRFVDFCGEFIWNYCAS
jgi:hypothetical protein